MTDKPTETGDDLSLQDDFSSSDSSTEAWQDALPPEDDFHDQDGVSEEVLDEMVEEATKQNEEVAPKRNWGGLISVLGVGILLLGGLAYFQFGDLIKGEETTRLPVSNVLSIKEIKNAPHPKEAESLDKKGLEAVGKVDMSAIYHQAQRTVASGGRMALPLKEGEPLPTERPEAVEKNTDILSSSDSMAIPPLPPVTGASPVMKESQDMKVEPTLSKKEETKESEVKSTPLAMTVKSKEGDMGSSARINEMMTQIESFKKELNHSLEQNAQLVSQLETLRKPMPSSQEVALREQVSQLEQKLAAKDKKQENTPLVLEEKRSVSVEQTADAFEKGGLPPETLSATNEGKKTEKAAPQKARAKTPVKKGVKKKRVTPVSPSWVLRAATPDAAWIASGLESQELRRVAVGETLQGLGKVKEIRQKGEKWEVIGEKGTLR